MTEAYGRAGMVTSPHRLASEAGREVLKSGGTAIEAAVAMGAVLAVVYPHFCGLGGDAVWLVGEPGGPPRCFLGIGRAAAEVRATAGPIPTRGGGSALTSAALVDSWRHALDYSREKWGGQMRFGALLHPAIGLAEGGFPLSRSQAFWLDFRGEEASNWFNFAATFGPDAGAAAGERFRQPGLARTLKQLAEDGPRAFYEGELARRLVAGLAAAGSPLSEADLAATATVEVEPIGIDYAGLHLIAPPPPTQGVTTLMIMGILDHLDRRALKAGSADDVHLLVEAVKQAFLDREEIADPDFVVQPVSGWLMPERLAAKAAAISPDRAVSWPHPLRSADTVFLAAVDSKGRAASVLQSLYFDWGSGVVAGDTGVLWQNRGAAFSTIPGHRNFILPGKRPFYTLNPGMALRDGRPALLYGTQGADGQPQTLSVLLTRLIDFGLSPELALRAPRFLLGRTFSDDRDNLKVEENAGDAVLRGLQRRGHLVKPIAAVSPLAGQAGVITIAPDRALSGAHDPRSDGLALGF